MQSDFEDGWMRRSPRRDATPLQVICRSAEPCGGEGIRTPDPLNAIQVLSQLSYTPGSRIKIQVKSRPVKSILPAGPVRMSLRRTFLPARPEEWSPK